MKITTSKLVDSTGMLYAKHDSGYHFSILPTAGDMNAWIASMSTVKTNPHKYTIALKNVVYYVSGVSK